MITQTATTVIDCSSQQEYEQAKAKLATISLPEGANVVYDPVFHRITITVTKTTDSL